MKILLTLNLLIFCVIVKAQDNYGFYGKKTYVELSSSSYVPLIYNLTNQEGVKKVSSSGNSLTRKFNGIHIGLRASIGHTMTSNIGVSIECGYDRFALSDVILRDYNSSPVIRDHESLLVNSFVILPKIEIAGRNGLLPNGLVHQIGLGATINSIVNKNYLVIYSGEGSKGGPNGDPKDEEALFNSASINGSVKMVQMMYGLKMRTPIGKSLMINYGFRYTIDFGFDSFGFNRKVAQAIRQYQFRNIIAFDLGLTMPF